MVKFTFGRPVPAMSPYEESYVLASMPRRTIEREYYTRQNNYSNCQKAYKHSYSIVSWMKMAVAILVVGILVLVLSQSLKAVVMVAMLMVVAKIFYTRRLKRKADFAQERFEACPSLDQIKSRDDFRKSAPADISFEMGSIPRAKSNLDDFKLDDDFWADRTKPEGTQPQVVFETDDGDAFGHIDEPEVTDELKDVECDGMTNDVDESEDAECDDEIEADDTDDKLENLSKMIRELEDLIRQK